MRASQPQRPRVLTTTQAALVLGVHERTLRRYLAMGLLAHRRLPGGHYRIPVEALSEFWEANERPSVITPSRAARAQRPPGTPTLEVQRRQPSRPRPRRAQLGEDHSGEPYDLSTEALAALRAQLS